MEFHVAANGGNCTGCEWIAAEGMITKDTPKEFLEFIAKKTSASGYYPHSLQLNSPGGNAFAGIELGEAIRKFNMDTSVRRSGGLLRDDVIWEDEFSPPEAAECASACAFAFAGGVMRSATSSKPGQPSRIGVHQFYDPKVLEGPEKAVFSGLERSGDQMMSGVILEYLSRMGITSELWTIASMVPPWKEVHWLTDEELVRTKLDNTSVPPTAQIVGYKNGVANVLVEFARGDGDYKVELYCDAAKAVRMLVKIHWRDASSSEDVANYMNWKPYTTLRLEDGPSLTREDIDMGPAQEGGTEIKVRLRFDGIKVDDLAGHTSFKFADDASRYALINASNLSFELPKDFHGMRVLPRTCLKK